MFQVEIKEGDTVITPPQGPKETEPEKEKESGIASKDALDPAEEEEEKSEDEKAVDKDKKVGAKEEKDEGTEDKKSEEEEEGKTITKVVLVPMTEYVLGLADLTGNDEA